MEDVPHRVIKKLLVMRDISSGVECGDCWAKIDGTLWLFDMDEDGYLILNSVRKFAHPESEKHTKHKNRFSK